MYDSCFAALAPEKGRHQLRWEDRKKIVNLDIKDGKKLQIAALRHWLPKRECTSSAGRIEKKIVNFGIQVG